MVELNYKIFIAGMICLVIMYIACLVAGRDEAIIMTLIGMVVGMGTGVVIPAPKTNKKGVMKW